MTKTKIGVEIHKTGKLNAELLQIVSAHNEGIIDMSAPYSLIGYIRGTKGKYPDLHKNADLIMDETGSDIADTWHVTEDNGKTFTLTLTWKEVSELDLADNTDDIKDVLQGPGELEREIEKEQEDYRNTHKY